MALYQTCYPDQKNHNSVQAFLLPSGHVVASLGSAKEANDGTDSDEPSNSQQSKVTEDISTSDSTGSNGKQENDSNKVRDLGTFPLNLWVLFFFQGFLNNDVIIFTLKHLFNLLPPSVFLIATLNLSNQPATVKCGNGKL